ncbi:thioredoxin-disulfide reductase [bacterium]|nr:MAG: thioredoxin-disulfide reductase [bacterium]
MEFFIKKENEKKREYDALVIGAGPAGLTAAIYIARGRFSVLVFEKVIPGGLAATTHLIENYPGFPEGVEGEELGRLMEKQARNLGVEFAMEEVVDVELEGEKKRVKTREGEYEGKAVVIATGSSHKKLGVPGEDKFTGKGVSYCATCDAPFYKDKKIAVVGCGNSGMQEGLYLLRFVRSIDFIEYFPYIPADRILQERVKKHENVKFHLNHQVLEIVGDERVEGVRVKKRDTGEEKVIEVDGVFIFAGLSPNTAFLNGKMELEDGYVVTDEFMRTSIPGVFACGDVRKKVLRQVATAVGDGAVCGASVVEYLEGR